MSTHDNLHVRKVTLKSVGKDLAKIAVVGVLAWYHDAPTWSWVLLAVGATVLTLLTFLEWCHEAPLRRKVALGPATWTTEWASRPVTVIGPAWTEGKVRVRLGQAELFAKESELFPGLVAPALVS